MVKCHLTLTVLASSLKAFSTVRILFVCGACARYILECVRCSVRIGVEMFDFHFSEKVDDVARRFQSASPSLFLTPVSHRQESHAAADVGHRFVWLEDVQALTGETFRTDKKPDPANWEYKSLYRGDIARYASPCLSRFSLVGSDFFLPRALCVRSLSAPLPSGFRGVGVSHRWAVRACALSHALK